MNPREKRIYKVTLIGTAVNLVLIVLKFIAGFVGRSSAMVADAVHSLTDFITDVIVLVFVRISSKPGDSSHEYGHGKFETFATMIIGLILALAGVALLVNGARLAIDSFHGHQLPQPTYLALVIALVSIVSKEILYRYTIREGKAVNSEAVIANAWHHRSDAISSAGTLVGVGGAMFLGPRWRVLDPLAAVAVSFFIIKAGYDIMHPCIHELLEGALPKKEQAEIVRIARSVDGITAIHNLRTRKVGNNVAIDLHASMDGDMTLRQAHALASEVERRIRAKYGRSTFINVHMEPDAGAK